MTPSSFGTAVTAAIQQTLLNQLATNDEYLTWSVRPTTMPPEVELAIINNINWRSVIAGVKGKVEEALALRIANSLPLDIYSQLQQTLEENPLFMQRIVDEVKKQVAI